MTLGQLVKNTLAEWSKLNWQRKKIRMYNTSPLEEHTILEVIIDQYFSIQVAQLINGGLNNLKKQYKQYEHIKVFQNNNLYVRLISHKDNQHQSLSETFFKELEVAITNYVEDLSLNWTKSTLSANEVLNSLKDKGNAVVYERLALNIGEPVNSVCILVGRALKDYFWQRKVGVTNIAKGRSTNKSFIVGNEPLVLKFINSITADLSPLYYSPEIDNTKPDISAEMSLKNLCVKAISRYSLYYPDVFSLKKLPEHGLPQELLQSIEEINMEHVQESQGMSKYKNQIIIFKTNSYYLGGIGYFIYPGRMGIEEQFMAGIVSERMDEDQDEIGHLLHLLISTRDDIEYNEDKETRVLTTAQLTFSDFKVRLPLPHELDKIQKIIQKKHGLFKFFPDEDEIIMKMIETQKIDALNEISHISIRV